MEAPYIPHALPSQTGFEFLSQWHNRICHFISDIMDYFWLAKTSNKPISLTTWLAANPLTCNLIREYEVVDRLGDVQGNSCSCAVWRWINCLWTKVGNLSV